MINTLGKQRKKNYFASLFSFFIKRQSIPKRFFTVFDSESYLYANPDVEKSIQSGQFKNAIEHFTRYGYEEVKAGKRRIGTLFPFMTEKEYLDANLDLQNAKKQGLLESPFEHFIHFGYDEILQGKRKLAGHYPFELTDELLEKLKKNFNVYAKYGLSRVYGKEEIFSSVEISTREKILGKELISYIKKCKFKKLGKIRMCLDNNKIKEIFKLYSLDINEYGFLSYNETTKEYEVVYDELLLLVPKKVKTTVLKTDRFISNC